MWFLNAISILLFACVKILTHLFFWLKVSWVGIPPVEPWSHDLRLFIFLNHTSLFEPLFIGAVPFRFIFWGAPRIVVPGADRTLARPLVGRFFKLLCPKMISITRKRDETWDEFLSVVQPDSLVVILPEGRMMRRTGLDKDGNLMSIRGGVSDILENMNEGQLLIGYSGGLHHVQAPGEWSVGLFKTISVVFEKMPIREYKDLVTAKKGNDSFKVAVIRDLTERQKKHCPQRT